MIAFKWIIFTSLCILSGIDLLKAFGSYNPAQRNEFLLSAICHIGFAVYVFGSKT